MHFFLIEIGRRSYLRVSCPTWGLPGGSCPGRFYLGEIVWGEIIPGEIVLSLWDLSTGA